MREAKVMRGRMFSISPFRRLVARRYLYYKGDCNIWIGMRVVRLK